MKLKAKRWDIEAGNPFDPYDGDHELQIAALSSTRSECHMRCAILTSNFVCPLEYDRQE